jgi:pimeloyl-ACP methyl ester carboxylesterase
MKNIILPIVLILLLLTACSCNDNKKQDDMAQIKSKDGTRIAFDKTGSGPAIIVVNGALSYREVYSDNPLVSALSKDFTIYTYDRRGRGESTDTKPYNVEREIEDIEALINDAGGSAHLYGVSSGAALSLLAAARLGEAKVPKLVLYEPPYVTVSEKDKQHFENQGKRIGEMIKSGNRGDAMAFHFTAIGTPPEALEKLRKTPEWPLMENVEHTLAYDYAVLNDGAIPVDAAKGATMPALVMYGEKSFDFMKDVAKNLSKTMPNAEWKALKDQAHQPSPKIIVPVLAEFFKEHKNEMSGQEQSNVLQH